MSELADRLRIARRSVIVRRRRSSSTRVPAVERAGGVRADRASVDRRRRTPAGRRLLDELVDVAAVCRRRRLTSTLSPAELTTLRELLSRIAPSGF